MRFVVPQFIEVEDKVVGPLTFKQGAYIIGAGGVALMLLTQFGFFWAMVLGSPLYALAGALAFVKFNNRPFSAVLYSLFTYGTRKKLYLWKKTEPEEHTEILSTSKDTQDVENNIEQTVRGTTQSRLKELAWALDSQQENNTANSL
jgi:hypothetical protein